MLDKGSTCLRVDIIMEVLRRNIYHVPKSCHKEILKEMEQHNLIEKINNRAGYRIYNVEHRIIEFPL